MKSPYRFFMQHTAISYNPETETPLQGRVRCAVRLADAERWASSQGMSFEWSIDPFTDSSDWDESPEPWQAWQCVMRDMGGAVVQTLNAIDFGREGSPWGDPYRRVVQAELACEVMSK